MSDRKARPTKYWVWRTPWVWALVAIGGLAGAGTVSHLGPRTVMKVRALIAPSKPTGMTIQTNDADLRDGSQIATSLLPFDVTHIPVKGQHGGAGAVVSAEGLTLFLGRSGEVTRLDGAPERLTIPTPEGLPSQGSAEFGQQARNLGLRHAALTKAPEAWQLAVSYLTGPTGEDCLQLSVAVADLVPDDTNGSPKLDQDGWRTWPAPVPCMHPEDTTSMIESGGALAYAPDGALWLTIGAFGAVEPGRRQYSGVFRLNRTTGDWAWVANGLRNPSGITFDPKGRGWIIDHGPRGGDELNLIRQGADYGWPDVSYGTSYFSFDETKALASAGSTDTPLFAWVPSIAPSDVVAVDPVTLPAWGGDLLVSSLRAQTLHRLKLDENRIVYEERINVGTRVRDLAVSDTGDIFLLLDRSKGIFRLRPLAADQPTEVAVLSMCQSCHAAGPDGAPSLVGIIGRPIAGDATFEYSPALKAKEGTWTKEALTAYLSEPQAFAPGTTMPRSYLSPYRLEPVLDALGELEAASD